MPAAAITIAILTLDAAAICLGTLALLMAARWAMKAILRRGGRGGV